MISTLILVGNYVIVSIAAQAVRGSDFLTAHSDDVLSAVGKIVLGNGINKFLIVAVLTSAAASTQTTILPAARSALSMAVHKAIPEKFAETHPRYLTPTFATVFFGVVSCVWYVGLTILSDNVLQASILAVGLMIAFYYGLTGFACVAYFIKYATRDVKSFINLFLFPLLGGLMLFGVLGKSIYDDLDPTFNDVGSVFGLGLTNVVGLGLLIVAGVPLMLLCRRVAGGKFFRIKADPLDVRPDPEADVEAPPLGTYTKETVDVG